MTNVYNKVYPAILFIATFFSPEYKYLFYLISTTGKNRETERGDEREEEENNCEQAQLIQ